AALGDVARELPHEGRLLFLRWRRGALARRYRELPRDLESYAGCTARAQADPACARRPARGILHRAEARRARTGSAGHRCLDAVASLGPARAMRLRSQLRPPARLTAETDPASSDADPALIEALADEDFEASYDALFDEHVTTRQQLL